jgi:hypothetical protein
MKKYPQIDFKRGICIVEGIEYASPILNLKFANFRKLHKQCPDEQFRAQWQAYAVAGGYSVKWADDLARAAGIRLRAPGAGAKPKSKSEKANDAFVKWLAAMPSTLNKTQIKSVQAKLTEM